MLHRQCYLTWLLAAAMILTIYLPFEIGLHASEMTSDEDPELIKLSFYRGYLLWREQLMRPGVSYDLDQVIAGMRAAEKGEYPKNEDPVELEKLVRKLQEHILAKEKDNNLANAECFLASIRAEKDSIEIVKDRLYFKRLKVGSGPAVKANSSPVLTFEARTLELQGEEDFFDKPNQGAISLPNTIPGFAQGVTGMLSGERRRLFIHPELAYGVDGGLVGPNRLIIFDVEVASLE